MKVSLSPRAYAKVLLHGCKYPHKAINGVFLAEECKHTGDLLRIVDAIPLFHQCLGLAPMLEIALHQVSIKLNMFTNFYLFTLSSQERWNFFLFPFIILQDAQN